MSIEISTGDNPMKLNDVEHDAGVGTTSSPELDALNVPVGDVLGTVFIIPIDAPIPLELSDFVVPTGPLLKRLQPLAEAKPTDDIAIVPISGSELLALSRAWTLLKEARSVAVLTELPGARDDLIFTQARRQIGLKTVDWPSLSEAFATRKVEKQRRSDTQPWLEKTDPDKALRKARGSNLRQATEGIPTPKDDYADTDEV
jgi:hypothetical protein